MDNPIYQFFQAIDDALLPHAHPGKRLDLYHVGRSALILQGTQGGQEHFQHGKRSLTLPLERAFQLYAMCSRYPHNLANEMPLEHLQEGVYRCRRGTDVFRVIVAGQLPRVEHNAPLHLFSASAPQVEYGASHYRQHSLATSSVLSQLFAGYQGEGIVMPYTMEDFRRDFVKEHFKDLTPQERREILQGLSPEERLEGLSPEEIERFLQELKGDRPAAPSRRRRK